MSLGYGWRMRWGDRQEHAKAEVEGCFGKEIASVTLSTDVLAIRFVGGGKITLADDGQSCCERRWMTCDDSLDYYTGARLVGFRVLDTGGSGGEGEDIAFLHVDTDKGTFTCQTHNEHNGYYGGFSINARYSST